MEQFCVQVLQSHMLLVYIISLHSGHRLLFFSGINLCGDESDDIFQHFRKGLIYLVNPKLAVAHKKYKWSFGVN